MDGTDLNFLTELENRLPLVAHPYSALGARIGMREEEVISRIGAMKDSRIIRGMRARINQRKLGIAANALFCWRIPCLDPDPAGVALASMPGVTHCYRRSSIPGIWEYTHYKVHHGWSRSQIISEMEIISKKTGFSGYILLFSTHEYKLAPHVQVWDLVADS